MNVCIRKMIYYDRIDVSEEISILNIEGSDYCSIISLISKSEVIALFKNANLTEKVEYCKLKNIYLYVYIYIYIYFKYI